MLAASEPKETGNTLQTVSRAIALLRCFDEGSRALSLVELTRRMGLNKVTTFRLATTLVAEGMLNKHPETGAYSVSFGLLSLGRALLDPDGLITRAQPIVRAAQEATGETAIVNLKEGREAVVVFESLSPQPIRYSLGIGYRADLRLGAASVAILSLLPDWEVEAILAEPAPARADGGHISADSMRAELSEIRRTGFATTEGLRVPDAAGYAAPFVGIDGAVVGSISVVMPASRNREKKHQQLCIETVRLAARDLTTKLGRERSVA